jgi:hypothetical protein
MQCAARSSHPQSVPEATLLCAWLRAAGDPPARLPRIAPTEVGFGEEGRKLGMPKRPAWRGVVRRPLPLTPFLNAFSFFLSPRALRPPPRTAFAPRTVAR